MTFDDSLDFAPTGQGEYAGATSDGYWNLIGPFGGWIAALLLRAMAREALAGAAPLSLSTNFVAAMSPGPYQLSTRRMRRNRSTDFWFAELTQTQDSGGALQHCAHASSVFAVRRPAVPFVEVARPVAVEPEALRPISERRTVTKWFARYDIRVASGSPYDSEPTNRTIAWVRDADARPLDYVSLAALCDCSFPQIFTRARRMLPISTVTMNAFFHATPAELDEVGGDFILSDSSMRIAANGFFDMQTTLWSRSGRLLATTEQVVWYKLPPEV